MALRALRAGFAVSEFDFDYDLDFLADWTPPILAVRGGEQFVPGIAGSIPGGDFGSMVNSPSGDLTAPVWAADLTLPSPGAELVGLGLRGGGLRRHAGRARSC